LDVRQTPLLLSASCQPTNTAPQHCHLPDLSLLVSLHPQLTPELINGAVVDTAVSSVVDDSASGLVSVFERKAHLDVPGVRPSTEHEIGAFVGIVYQYCLLDSLVDNELIADKMIFNLG
jgi:hypothetical protein